MNINILGSQQQGVWDRQSGGELVSHLALSKKEVKRILVAVDFSDASRNALEFGAALAKQLQAEIVLLHMFEGVPGELRILEAAYADTSFREQARENLAEWEGQLKSLGGKVRTVFREGTSAGREIVRAAAEIEADLIVLGRHGPQSFFLKNTVRQVLARAACPVLVGE